MAGPLQIPYRVLILSAAAAIGCWRYLPGTTADRAAFEVVAGSFANPPLFVSGHGTHSAPWQLGVMTAKSKPDQAQAPWIVSMGDDLAGYFQSSPPAPIDLAVIFSNLQRLGVTKAATAAVFAWEAPDPIGLAALDKALAGFDSLTMATPLSRSVVSSPLPAAFRRASLPLEAILGDTTLLPTVNRIPLPGVILGGDNSLAGFSYLESEPVTALPPLLARWEDRVVFSFPLLTVLVHGDFPLDKVEVKLGEYLKLSVDGPVLPIDASGRLAMPISTVAPFAEIAAEDLIDGGADLFSKSAPVPVILRDDQSAAEPATRAFSKSLSTMVAALASNNAFAQTTVYHRLTAAWEIGLLGGIVLLLGLLGRTSKFSFHIGVLVLFAAVLTMQWVGVALAGVWLPALPAAAAISAATLACVGVRTRSKPETVAADPPVPISSPKKPAPEPEPELKLDPEPVVKKSRAQAKKAPAKKAATPRKRRTKTPPTEN